MRRIKILSVLLVILLQGPAVTPMGRVLPPGHPHARGGAGCAASPGHDAPSSYEIPGASTPYAQSEDLRATT